MSFEVRCIWIPNVIDTVHYLCNIFSWSFIPISLNSLLSLSLFHMCVCVCVLSSIQIDNRVGLYTHHLYNTKQRQYYQDLSYCPFVTTIIFLLIPHVPVPNLWQPPLSSSPLLKYYLKIWYKWTQKAFNVLRLIFLTQYNSLETHSSYCLYQ